MPPRGPKGFDISARAYPAGRRRACRLEGIRPLGVRLSHQGNLVYCQATSVDFRQSGRLDLAREIRLALIQLSMQGLEISAHPHPALVAIPKASIRPRSPPPSAPRSKSRPARHRSCRILSASFFPPTSAPPAARRDRRKNIILGVAAVALLYLGIIGWFGYGLWKDSSETKKLLAQAKQAAPEGEAYALHVAKWDELADAIDLANSPVDILKRIADCIPPNSGLRLKTADISASEIKLIGEAPQLQAVNTFSLNLAKNNDLTKFEWQTPEPNQSTRGWEFVYTGEIPDRSPDFCIHRQNLSHTALSG